MSGKRTIRWWYKERGFLCKAKTKADVFYSTSIGDVKRTEYGHSIGSEILTTVNPEITVFRIVTPCSLEYMYLELRL